jgi:uncharacterized membrane protein
MWFDEVFSWHITQGSFKDIITDTSVDIHPPLYYFILKVWEFIFGQSVLALRNLSVILASAAIFFIYPISRKVLNIENSILVILLYTISPLNLFFSQEVRMSALNLLLNAGSIFFFIKILESEADIKTFFKKIYTYGYIVFTLLALYTHYFSFFLLASQVLFLFYTYKQQSKKIIQYAIIYLIIVLTYLAWLPTMFMQVTKGQSWRYSHSISIVIKEFYKFIKDLSIGFYFRYTDHTIPEILGIITLFIFCLVLFLIFKKVFANNNDSIRQDTYQARVSSLIVFTAIIPIFLAILISFRQWIEYFRYLSIIIPFILIVLVLAFENLNKWFRVIILVVFMITNLYGDYLYYKYDFKNNDYRELIRILNRGDTKQDNIFVYPHYFGWIINYYRIENNLNYPAPFNYGWEFSMLLDSVKVEKPENLWLVMDYHSADQPTYTEKLNSLEKFYKISYVQKFKVEPDTVALYKLEKATHNP